MSGQLILVSGLGSIIGPLIGTSAMAYFSIDGLLYFVAATALLLALVAAAGRLFGAPPIHQARTFEILALQAAPLAHDLLGASDDVRPSCVRSRELPDCEMPCSRLTDPLCQGVGARPA